jgi:NADPH-dependent ferric siderophore reductase
MDTMSDTRADEKPSGEGRGLGGYIAELEPLTPTSTRIRLVGPKLAGFRWTAGDHIRIRIGSVFTLRTYSIWDADPEANWLEVVLFNHGTPGSIGLAWAENLQLRQYVKFMRDPRTFKIEPDASYVNADRK